jgi:excisionase family DNA binding protein
VPRLLNIPEVADLLGCSPRTVHRRIADGALPAFRDGQLVRVSERDLEDYIADRTAKVSVHQAAEMLGRTRRRRRRRAPA